MNKSSKVASSVSEEVDKVKTIGETVDAPAERFQNHQAQTSAAAVAAPQAESFIRKKMPASGSQLRQEVAAEVVTDNRRNSGVGGGVMTSPSSFGLRAAAFSGDTGTILGNVSGTPNMADAPKGQSRLDKRISDANKEINYNASEQVLVEYQAIPALADSDDTVGYNGNPKNAAARAQKNVGFTPSEELYDRSLDIIAKDEFVFSVGQVVKQHQVDYRDYPTKTRDANGAEANFTVKRGNYAPRFIVVKFKRTSGGPAFVSSFAVTEDDVSTGSEKYDTVNASGTNEAIDINRAELARQTIDADAGSPTSDHFNPLGRSVPEATAVVTYLQDIENVMGAELFTAYRFANKARAHFLNRTAKDGQQLVAPGLDALYGHLTGVMDSSSSGVTVDERGGAFYSTAGAAAGSAAVLLKVFDSVTKYQTKGDLVNQPRGLKLHLQTAANNLAPFRVKTDFVKALNGVDCYSTMDHGYDPMAPVYITDNVRLIHPYSWTAALGFTRETSNGARVYSSTPLRYQYAAGSGQNSYQITVGEPILNGLAYFFEQHARAFHDALGGTTNNEVTLTIPTVHSTLHFSLWDLILCAATPYITYERTNALKDILDYEMFYKYPIQGNVPVLDAEPLSPTNYGVISPYSQLTVKEMLPASAMLWKYPEMLTRIYGFRRSNEGRYVLLPWYFNEADFTSSAAGSFTPKADSYHYTTPIVRSGVKLKSLDDFFGQSAKDNLLITDRMTRVPGNIENAAFTGAIYKYSKGTDGLVAVKDPSITGLQWAATPRLLGWYFDAPLGSCFNATDTAFADIPALSSLTTATATDNLYPSYRAIMYRGVLSSGAARPTDILGNGAVNVNRSQTFAQDWYMRYSNGTKSTNFDLILSFAEALRFVGDEGSEDIFGPITGVMTFDPLCQDVSGTQLTRPGNRDYWCKLFSVHKVMWAMVQKLSFVLNPFEYGSMASGTSSGAADPFTLQYTFGLAGFAAADYAEELYNRQSAYMNQGYGYTQDPMVIASPIMR